MEWYLYSFRNYFTSSGRARRTEYWMFTLVNAIFVMLAILLDNVFSLTFEGENYGVLYSIYIVASIIPTITVLVRRLHDIGKNGWYILLYLIPIIGAIIVFIFTVMDSQPGDNEYGPNPKEERLQSQFR